MYESLLCERPNLLPDGSIDFNLGWGEEILPYKTVNMLFDMTDPCYENRPSVETLIKEYAELHNLVSSKNEPA